MQRFKDKIQTKSINSKATVNASSKHNNDNFLNLPDVPDDEPQPKENDEITCNELLQILNEERKHNKKRLLIVDIRSKKDYLESTLAFQDSLINIPIDILELDIVQEHYNFLALDVKNVIEHFNEKSVHIVALVASNSSFGIKKNSSSVQLLKKFLEKWNIFPKRFVILKGGFQEWKKCCPSMIKHRTAKESAMINDILDNISDRKSYNSISSTEKLSPILSTIHPPGVKVKQFLPSNFEASKNDANTLRLHNENNRDPSNSTDNFSSKSEVMANDSRLLRNNNMKQVKIVLDKIPMESCTKLPLKPPVDRSNKPNLDHKLSDAKDLQKNFTEVQRSCLQHEKNYFDGWSREQSDTLRKSRQEKTILKGRKEQARIYPDLSGLQLQRKKEIEHREQYINRDKENIQELRKRVDQSKIEPPTSQSMDIDDKKIYAVPLKPENSNMNSGLKRSISSPNLMQGKNDPKRTPDFSRSLKPNRGYDNLSSGISLKNREQCMEPVYASPGSCPGITGLKNLGNSCYMNSIIQCLSNTAYLAQYFINNSYINDLNKNTDKGVTGYVAEEVAQVIKALWRGQFKSISPRDLKVVVGQYKLQFESFDQQDSHEFLMFLLDWMHNDLKQKSKVSYDRPLSTAEKEWEKSMDGQSSKISELFFGQLRSTIECVHCSKNSTTFETFNSLTMSLPGSSKCSLDDCVRKFVSSQKVSGWKCPNCKVPREGMKKFEIAKLPHIIVIHLNRFGDTGGWLEKKNTAVEFPLCNFTLRTYFSQDDNHLNNSQASNYNLYAMSNHYGTMDGGHYTAYCKNNTQNKWYKYDDHTVTEVHQNQVKSQSNSAYLLFYTSVSAEPYLNS
ncbi:PREDICTED: ubiquitin carboxyl-terminal hydrolase 8 isoform X2 [Ceratosolen solmsi marchali]|uniref:Ubiquitin carboxyl-terminal hydrolase n=1 Tax=Ceratosolen solmsi marchali TaxID=326594 RepID=A0AAJ7E211_9HYME|nr:PREDICTED: ubiquitin carboxyl-terminal hydrolase 8 isoform X2 [Ceratosolen solmsi marchali]